MTTTATAPKPLEDLTQSEIQIIGQRLLDCFCKNKGFQVLERPEHEVIDLIARDGEELAFISLKTRIEGERYTTEMVTDKKREQAQRYISNYMEKNPSDLMPRFDMAGISLESSTIAHIHYITAINLDS